MKLDYFSITSDSKLAHRGKKGIITYFHTNGMWKSTHTSDETSARTLQRKWDTELFYSANALVNRDKTWGEFKEDYLASYAADNAPATVADFKRTISRFERTVFGDGNHDARKLITITPEMCDRYKLARLKTVRPQTFKNDLTRLSPMFEKARKRKYIESNPFDDVKCPATKIKKEQRPLRIAEADACVAWIKREEPQHALLGQLAFDTGMRREEMVHVQIENVSFTTGILHLKQHEKCGCVHCLKTEDRRWLGKAGVPRDIPLAPESLAMLLDLYQRQKTGVISTMSPASVSKLFRRAFDRAGLSRDSHAHTFRHTMATDLERAGVRRGVQMDILGHVPSSTTDGYVHATEQELRDGMKKLQDWRQAQRGTLKTTQIDGVNILEATA